MTADRLYLTPLPVSAPGTYTKLSVNITTPGNVGAKIRVGIYAEAVDGYPAALLADLGEADATSTGIVSFSMMVPIAAPSALYLAVVTMDPTVVLQSYDATQNQPLGVYFTGTSTVTPKAITVDLTFGALPTDLTATQYTANASTGFSFVTTNASPRGVIFL